MASCEKAPSHNPSADSPVLEDEEKVIAVEQSVEGVKEENPEAFYISKYKALGLGPLLNRLFSFGVEARGVERIPEDQRDSRNSWDRYARSFLRDLG